MTQGPAEVSQVMARIACATALGAALALGGCSVFEPAPDTVPVAGAELLPPPIQAPLATHTFPFDPGSTGVVGQVQVTHARHEDTLADIARRFDLGYDEVVNANPGVDPWLPGAGTRVVLPTMFVLPDAPTDGIVVNLAALRMFHFPPASEDGTRVVHTYPIGIGKVGWATPAGTTTVVSKRRNPWWTPPVSVRREHAAEGDPLPARVPPGPDNPLGTRAMNLGWESYLIHGTNKPAGVGLRASHGCIRMYPEDIEVLFERVPVGLRVTVVNQPLLQRWHGDTLYVQSYPVHEELRGDGGEGAAEHHPPYDAQVKDRLWQEARQYGVAVNWPVAEQAVRQARGVAVPVTRRGLTIDRYLATARHVENVLPAGANWQGEDGASPEPASRTSSTGGR